MCTLVASKCPLLRPEGVCSLQLVLGMALWLEGVCRSWDTWADHIWNKLMGIAVLSPVQVLLVSRSELICVVSRQKSTPGKQQDGGAACGRESG